MGTLLRLDRRVEVSEQAAGSATVITECLARLSSGWLAAIVPHDRPSERLRRWGRVQVRPAEMDIEAGAGTKTYLELAEGLYEAASVWRDDLAHKTAFRVDPAGRVEVLSDRGRDPDRVLAAVLGVDARGLHDAREAHYRSLRESAAAAGLVALEGTDRMKVWAESFRLAKFFDAADYLDERRAELAGLAADDPGRHRVELAVEWLAYALESMRDQADAGWWIDRVGDKGRETLRKHAKQLRDAGHGVARR
jgi:hypothetical protein